MTKLRKLFVGNFIPTSWYKEKLTLLANNNSSIIGKYWKDLSFESAWLGGKGEAWERGPYYLDGLIPLSVLLNEEFLISLVNKWSNHLIESQRANGDFGPIQTIDIWPKMIALKALVQLYEQKKEEKLKLFFLKALSFIKDWFSNNTLKEWARARGYDLILFLHWCAKNKITDEDLKPLAKVIREQTFPWSNSLCSFGLVQSTAVSNPWDSNYKGIANEDWYIKTHCVNIAMSLKCYYLDDWIDDTKHSNDLLKKAINNLYHYHGFANGIFSGSEHLAGYNPSQGSELCSIVEMLFSLEESISSFPKDYYLIEMIESIVYNALPTSFSYDMECHQYLQQPNQISCTIDERIWYNNDSSANTFGLEPHFGCCTANLHQGYPKIATAAWFVDSDCVYSGIYLPGISTIAFNANESMCIEVVTHYPNSDTILLNIRNSIITQDKTLCLRIPSWCKDASCFVNEKEIISQNGVFSIKKTWKQDDKIKLVFPFSVRYRFLHKSIAIYYGPLLYCLSLSEQWTVITKRERFSDYEVTSEDKWNYCLVLNKNKKPNIIQTKNEELLVEAQICEYWTVENNVAKAPDKVNIKNNGFTETVFIKLTPYYQSRLHISQFPYIIKKENSDD